VFLDDRTVELWRIDPDHIATVLASPSSVAREALTTLRLRIEVAPSRFTSLITVRHGDEVLFQHSDATYTGPSRTEQSFAVVTDDQRISLMREAARALRREREAAFYAERQYSVDDGRHAVSAMEHFVETAAMFISVQQTASNGR
jgi:hypothetical protein